MTNRTTRPIVVHRLDQWGAAMRDEDAVPLFLLGYCARTHEAVYRATDRFPRAGLVQMPRDVANQLEKQKDG